MDATYCKKGFHKRQDDAGRESGQTNERPIVGYSFASISVYSFLIPANAADTVGKWMGVGFAEILQNWRFFRADNAAARFCAEHTQVCEQQKRADNAARAGKADFVK